MNFTISRQLIERHHKNWNSLDFFRSKENFVYGFSINIPRYLFYECVNRVNWCKTDKKENMQYKMMKSTLSRWVVVCTRFLLWSSVVDFQCNGRSCTLIQFQKKSDRLTYCKSHAVLYTFFSLWYTQAWIKRMYTYNQNVWHLMRRVYTQYSIYNVINKWIEENAVYKENKRLFV